MSGEGSEGKKGKAYDKHAREQSKDVKRIPPGTEPQDKAYAERATEPYPMRTPAEESVEIGEEIDVDISGWPDDVDSILADIRDSLEGDFSDPVVENMMGHVADILDPDAVQGSIDERAEDLEELLRGRYKRVSINRE